LQDDSTESHKRRREDTHDAEKELDSLASGREEQRQEKRRKSPEPQRQRQTQWDIGSPQGGEMSSGRSNEKEDHRQESHSSYSGYRMHNRFGKENRSPNHLNYHANRPRDQRNPNQDRRNNLNPRYLY
jgi:hypothetical protein